ncbi:heme ABC transporter ATP-binding protein [Octadecabacter ascidiaceicola]|uniref:Hemin import ATP-binding protein HmuV n=1 Tax=Octadecabacter ascidiaceicola TaxID=1655543 RepID=A0A238JM40_9RHOB|nr:heme ABC transporter ATP-binding protein [Octadecabacter ascidiaceicola]SMX30846.1 Hemin import ATP-binding protein HmuV [Octadecabacter ascidiaceicola]
MLIATKINVSIGKTPILHGVNFDAQAGQLSAVVGPNGSGKTTLLKAMTGDLPYTGSVVLDGTDVKVIPGTQLATRRAVLPQAAGLAFPFTVLEVVRLGLTAGLGAQDRGLPQRALAHVGLAGFEGRLYHALSGGEQQRCQLARVLTQVWEPKRDGQASWLFLDEPVSALDIGHQLEVMTIARQFADAGGAVVAVMHDLNLTSMFADSILLMKSGHSVVQGNPQAVLSDEYLSRAYGCRVRVNVPPFHVQDAPYILPHMADLI